MNLSPEYHIQEVSVAAGEVELKGNLVVPEGATSIVVFAHGSGSSRHSPRNKYVANVLQKAGLATLLMDLLTPEEEAIDLRTRHIRFDIALLASRLVNATYWLANNSTTARLKIGYFGASTGASAALVAAAKQPQGIKAVVSRGGRPDLAGSALSDVQAPTLLIVGELDIPLIEVNENALKQLQVPKKLAIVPGATHLFEEPGALAEVAKVASDWFKRYLV